MASTGILGYVVALVFLLMLIPRCDGYRKGMYIRSKRTLTLTKFDIPKNGRQCHDYCALMSHMCKNGGTCVTDPLTCEGRCECSSGWTGMWCRNRTQTTDHQLPKSAVVGHLSVLTESALEHENEVNTVTNSANIEKLMKVATALPQHERNNLKPSGQHSNEGKNSSSSASVNSNVRNLCQQNCPDGNCYHIDGEYKCKARVNSSEPGATKVCGPGFECDHGVCDLEALKNNSYGCKCEKNYVGQFCTLMCPLQCGEHGFCDYHIPDNTYKCFCDWNYSGVNCSEPVMEKYDVSQDVAFVIPHWYVVGIPVAVVTLVLSAMILAAYFMWRKRLVFILKIVHYFQHYEDDDGKQFDAFISYKSSPEDETFVLQQLYPRLESHLNFRLCLHFRDFVPGEAIANNIVRAIENSRRTIMVLSPAYVKSEWCRMEYQKAQHEMLKLKHKIIPIVLEDVSELTNLDKNLKSILNSVTYIEWPGSENGKRLDRFWKKLELSMPKRSCNSSSYLDRDPDHLSFNSISSSTKRISENSEKEATSTSSRPHRSKGKDLKHFMGKLVPNKLFNRQDSNSSQVTLVEEETVASRSSYDSMSESVFTESSESACSTPVLGHSYLDSVDANHEIPNIFVSNSSREVHACKENMLQFCEKDHCEGSDCSVCLEIEYNLLVRTPNSDSFVHRGCSSDHPLSSSACRYCKRSDYNRVRISAIDGYKLKIQKLEIDPDLCLYCQHQLNRIISYRGSMKEHKDAANRELLKQSRVGSLPRNYKRSSELVRKETAIDMNMLEHEIDSKRHLCIDLCEDV